MTRSGIVRPSRVAPAAVASFVALLAPVARAQELPDIGRIASLIRWSGVAASIPLVLAVTFLIGVLDRASDRLGARFAHRRPLIQKVQTSARFLLYVATLGVAVGLSMRLDATALTLIGGALAFAVGFAIRDLVASFVAGITIIFDRPFQVGDRVSYGGEYGDIVKIGLRSVRMLTLDHNVITIPNNKVFTDVASSGNYGALEMQVPMVFHVGVDEDAQRAAEIVREACLTSPYVFLGQPVAVFARQVIFESYLAVELKARPYVFDCKYEKPFETDVHLRVMQAFRERGIRPPAVLHRGLAAPGRDGDPGAS